MVNHIVLWNLNEDMSLKEKKEAALEIKNRLEAAAKEAEGVVFFEVVINDMESSNKDIALISKFETQEALKAYQVSPAHIAAGSYVSSVANGRSCFDYKE